MSGWGQDEDGDTPPATTPPHLRLVSPPRQGDYHFRDDEEIANLPPPEWLIEPFVQRETQVLVYGEPEAGKSFLQLEWALAARTRQPTLGTIEEPWSTAYIVGEGVSGLTKRVNAWKIAREWPRRAGVYFLGDAINLLDGLAVHSLIGDLQALPEPPKLVVFDTLSRCAPGADENSAQDMGRVVSATDRIKKATRATVVLVHHPSRGGKERGSTVLRAGMDTVIVVDKPDRQGVRFVRCEKQKDVEHFPPMGFRLRVVDLGDGQSSCVVEPTGAAASPQRQAQPQVDPQEAPSSDAIALTRVLLQFGSEGASAAEWQRASGLTNGTFFRIRYECGVKGLLEETVSGKSKKFTPKLQILHNLLQV